MVQLLAKVMYFPFSFYVLSCRFFDVAMKNNKAENTFYTHPKYGEKYTHVRFSFKDFTVPLRNVVRVTINNFFNTYIFFSSIVDFVFLFFSLIFSFNVLFYNK